MPKVHFTPHLLRHLDCENRQVEGDTIGACLENAFRGQEQLRAYILDDQGRVRRHVMIFHNGRSMQNRNLLSQSVTETDELFVMQALSGG
ncbi:MAG: MoaD/ThiS family protein [Planctomycetota bacterium]|nr:MAG: MoaD/ThiS family protein [Planctomycetota bacterium]